MEDSEKIVRMCMEAYVKSVEEAKQHVKEIEKELPEERAKVLKEVLPLIEKINQLKVDLDKVFSEFVTETGKNKYDMKPLGKVGRWFWCSTARHGLNITLNNMKKIRDSLAV